MNTPTITDGMSPAAVAALDDWMALVDRQSAAQDPCAACGADGFTCEGTCEVCREAPAVRIEDDYELCASCE